MEWKRCHLSSFYITFYVTFYQSPTALWVQIFNTIRQNSKKTFHSFKLFPISLFTSFTSSLRSSLILVCCKCTFTSAAFAKTGFQRRSRLNVFQDHFESTVSGKYLNWILCKSFNDKDLGVLGAMGIGGKGDYTYRKTKL